jgi:hypothetical protein
MVKKQTLDKTQNDTVELVEKLKALDWPIRYGTVRVIIHQGRVVLVKIEQAYQ